MSDEQLMSRPEPIWCIIANVMDEHHYGMEGKETRRGTRHFPPGAKVHCFPPLWGDGYTSIKVVGRHRGGHRYVTMVIPSKWLRNWRVSLVYSPHVITEMADYWDGTEESKRLAEEMVQLMLVRTEVPHAEDH